MHITDRAHWQITTFVRSCPRRLSLSLMSHLPAGRIRKGPAPLNLEVPEYGMSKLSHAKLGSSADTRIADFPEENKLVIG